MRKRLIKRRRFAEAMGLTDHRPPMLDGELDDHDGNEGPVYNPVSLLLRISLVIVRNLTCLIMTVFIWRRWFGE